MSALTFQDKRMIARARELAMVGGIDAIRARALTADSTTALASVFGEAKFLLGELAAIAERVTCSDTTDAAAEDTRRLGAIREVLSHFDWEYHDRQLALEAIERIAEGGQA